MGAPGDVDLRAVGAGGRAAGGEALELKHLGGVLTGTVGRGSGDGGDKGTCGEDGELHFGWLGEGGVVFWLGKRKTVVEWVVCFVANVICWTGSGWLLFIFVAIPTAQSSSGNVD